MAAFHPGSPESATLIHRHSRSTGPWRVTVLGTCGSRAHVNVLTRHRSGKSTMASGWAPDGAVQDQIDDTVHDGIQRARARMLSTPVEN